MWPSVMYERCAWDRDVDELAQIPKSRRRKITATYDAAVPAAIARQPLDMSQELLVRSSEVRAGIARFDQEQKRRGYALPALLLRSESSSSSQIERLTSSVRNVALAELCDKTPQNAQLIAANVAAMREALSQEGNALNVDSIVTIHDILMRDTNEALGVRNQQVWIGGTPYSPHGALFVPPRASRVPECLRDLIAFSEREDVDPLVKAAVFHAQFETIHPFTDGNGRTGRALLHRVLMLEEVLVYATLPISSGLLHNIDAYMGALDAYHEGNPEPIVRQVLDALELAVVLGGRMAKKIDAIIACWLDLTHERKGSASHGLAALLVKQPVVNVAFVANELNITDRAARNLIEKACERGILSKMGNVKRGAFYQASELIEVLEEASNEQGIRRILSTEL